MFNRSLVSELGWDISWKRPGARQGIRDKFIYVWYFAGLSSTILLNLDMAQFMKGFKQNRDSDFDDLW